MTTSEFVPQSTRFAVFVDAGYLYAASGALLLGANSRREYRVQAEPLIRALSGHATEQLRGELLRVYWFDAAPKRQPTVDQRVIANLPQVKLRLGNLNAQGQQKGVDAQLRADLEALALHRAITDAVLLAGDEDMLPAVEAAQRFGVRVHLWGVEPTHGSNQAEWLVWESDTVEVLPADFLRPYFKKVVLAVPTAEQVSAASGESVNATGEARDAASRIAAAPVPKPSQVFAGRTAPVPAGSRSHPASATVGAKAGASHVGAHGGGVTASTAPANSTNSTSPANSANSTNATNAANTANAANSANTTGSVSPASPGGVPADAKLGPERTLMLEIGEHVAQKWVFERGRDNIRDLLPGPILPPVIDKELLIEAEKELGRSLRPYQEARTWLRDGFWERVYREFGIGVGTSD